MFSHIFGAVFGGILSVGSMFGFSHAPVVPPSGEMVQPHATIQIGQQSAEDAMPVSATVERKDARSWPGGPQLQSGVWGSGRSASSSATAITSAAAVSSGSSVSGHVYTDDELLAMASSIDMTALPLGDGKYTTTEPKQGYVYVCHVATGGKGAKVNGPWIAGTSWNAETKVVVHGALTWPDASNSFSVSGGNLHIVSNDLPTIGTTGVFPIAKTDPAYQYDGNQSSITVQNNSYALPANPAILSTPDCIYGEVGIMINGVTLDDAFDAEYRDAPAHEEQDSCSGHPNNEQGYHYHNITPCLTDLSEKMVIGYAFDGFPITGPEVADGKYLSTKDLDECHGLTSTINEDGADVTTYHYVMTYDFPYSVSCFRGTSHEPHPGSPATGVDNGSGPGGSSTGAGPVSGPGMDGAGMPHGGQPPQAAMSACSGKSSGASCSFSAPMGVISGTCATPPNQAAMACVPQR